MSDDQTIESSETIEPHLKIFRDRSILVNESEGETIFREGPPSQETKIRNKKIKHELSNGFLDKLIAECRTGKISWNITPEQEQSFIKLVSSVTSEQSRALLAITILQLCIKAIEPKANVRLHKGGHADFSWIDGVSMRGLDSEFIQPTLRKTDLLKYNIYGAMMTRGMAENYPYTDFYKASLRGPKQSWLQLINDLENGRLDPNHGLKKVISLLITRSDQFTLLCGKTIEQCDKYLAFSPPRQNIQALLLRHVNESQYPARLFEIAMHSLLQVLVEDESLGGFLRSLSQMRAANKKAGNIGDLEILALSDPNSEILEAWDAKYGKPYLYDELDELVDKLPTHKSIRRAGFVTNSKPDIRKEVIEKIDEIEDSLNIRIEILPFNEWIEEQLKRSNKGSDILIKEWLKAYIESICMMRREVAPIDEPTEGWVKEMSLLLQRSINEMRNRV